MHAPYPEKPVRNLPARRNICLLVAALALSGWPPSAEAGYFPTTPAAAASDLSAFLADFDRWDALLNYQPLVALASTPAQDRVDMVLVLWWLWANGYGRSSDAVGTAVSALSSFAPSLPPEGQPSPDLGSGGFTPPVPPLGDLFLPTPPIGIVSAGPSITPSGVADTSAGGGDGPPGDPSHPDFTAAPTIAAPESASLTLLSLGLAGLAGYGWLRRKA